MKKTKLMIKLGLCAATLLSLSLFNKTEVKAAKAQTTTTNSNVVQKDAVAENSALGPGYYDVNTNLSVFAPHYSIFSSFYAAPYQTQFLDKIKPGALAGWNEGVLPSITTAQAIVESGWGQSGLAIRGNNLFGIKGSYNGASIVMSTREYSPSRGNYYINANFRKYPSWAESIKDHANFLKNNSRYSNLLYKKDYHQVARLLQQDGYATDPNYANTLIGVIDAHGLASWDKEVSGSAQESEKVAKIVYVPGYGIVGYRIDGSMIEGSNKKFVDGSQWKTFGSKIINGQEMYVVGAGQYIPKKYTDHYDNGVVTIHYAPGYGVNAVRSDGTQIQNSNLKFKTGTEWKIVGVANIDGDIAYKVGTDTYILKKYTQWGTGK